MRILRGRAATPAADRAVTRELLSRTADTGDPGLRVWQPHRQLAFGRRETRGPNYGRARELAIDRGFPPTERIVGGQAVAHTESSIVFALTRPVADIRSGLDERYQAVTETLQRVLWRFGVPAQRGEPPGAFCPGNHSLSWKGKVAGVAQRVRADAALVGGVVIVRDHEEIAAVLDPIYDALGERFDPEAVGSVERAGGRPESEALVDALEEALAEDGAQIESV